MSAPTTTTKHPASDIRTDAAPYRHEVDQWALCDSVLSRHADILEAKGQTDTVRALRFAAATFRSMLTAAYHNGEHQSVWDRRADNTTIEEACAL